MASSGTPTQCAGLSQWLLTDKPGMDDFNEDNRKVDRKLQELEEKQDELAKVKRAQQWVTLNLLNGFSHNDRTQQLAYMKDGLGFVHLNGVFSNGATPAAGITIAVLPEGCRPNRQIFLPYVCNNPNWSAYAVIDTDGVIRLPSMQGVADFPVGKTLCISGSFLAV